MFLAHPEADICSLVAQSNKGTTSLSRVTVFKPSYFLWGSLVWRKDSKPCFCTMNTMVLRTSFRTVCRWTSASSPTRDALLSGDCVAGHQQGPWETVSSERVLINRYLLMQEMIDWCQNISSFNTEGYFWVLGSSSRENTSSSCLQGLLHQLQESQEGFWSWAFPKQGGKKPSPSDRPCSACSKSKISHQNISRY